MDRWLNSLAFGQKVRDSSSFYNSTTVEGGLDGPDFLFSNLTGSLFHAKILNMNINIKSVTLDLNENKLVSPAS